MNIANSHTLEHCPPPRSDGASDRTRPEELVLWSARRLAYKGRSSTRPTLDPMVFKNVQMAHHAWGVHMVPALLSRLVMMLTSVPAPHWRFLHPASTERSTGEYAYLIVLGALQRGDDVTAERLLQSYRCGKATTPIARLAGRYACELAIGNVCLDMYPHTATPC